ncbi:SDR family oxidoreductase [Aquimarina sp. RZ0]|uniref:SDR family NAD(P)-dependent oxidoreductase n=1 Tax=Aquimarina sp. RZ0 TaxID=2607730 RepID=UPI0011F18E42|nr:SDR family oxidoreductase [Aquimarina sp. RZ0]KAA1242138.1 SDR family oxidoreductase [Aquimarina sp. RZ0]
MNKTIVITGAGSGIGKQLALGLANIGNCIICLGRSEQKLLNTIKEIKSVTSKSGGHAAYFVTDMMKKDQVTDVGEKIIKQYKTIDVWINNVGVNNHNAIGPTWELDPENWWTEVSLNLHTMFLGSHTAINLMRKNNAGYIINLGGGGVQEPKPYGSAYGAAKTAIVKFTETVNIELKQEGLNIKIIAFNPGFIKNNRTEILVASKVARKYMPDLEQILKYGKMSDIQDSIKLILSFINGDMDDISGGYFFADEFDIDTIILDKKEIIKSNKNVLRIK